ncbi:MAG: BrnA antitoxin family protein [Lachnospiraceae bacterium]|nr:BrnA antitoxin family protein [Lachnospiraceae bacterium]
MATKKVTISKNQKLTGEQTEMLKAAATAPIEPDEELPVQTDEQLAQFRRLSEIKRAERRKQNVTLRLSASALKKARAWGKGYTSILSRILENALNDPEMIKRNL